MKKRGDLRKAFASPLANFGKVCYNNRSGACFDALGTINMKKYGLSRRNPMYRIGVDLGGTNIAVGLVNEEYQIVCKKSVPTNPSRGGEAIVADMAELCLALCREKGIAMSDITSVGIATPGIANHDTGVVEYANNLPFKNFPIAALLSQKLGGAKVFIENDANAAALGEAVAGAARGSKNSVMITLGTGVGGGIIWDGKVYSGFNYAGGELGHIVIEHGGRPCSCINPV